MFLIIGRKGGKVMAYIAQKITKEIRNGKTCKVHYLLAVTTKDLEEWSK